MMENILDSLIKEGLQVQIKEKFYSGSLGKDSHDFYYIVDRNGWRLYFRQDEVAQVKITSGTTTLITLKARKKYFSCFSRGN